MKHVTLNVMRLELPETDTRISDNLDFKQYDFRILANWMSTNSAVQSVRTSAFSNSRLVGIPTLWRSRLGDSRHSEFAEIMYSKIRYIVPIRQPHYSHTTCSASEISCPSNDLFAFVHSARPGKLGQPCPWFHS